jgi:ABC-2 type transport system permease protein
VARAVTRDAMRSWPVVALITSARRTLRNPGSLLVTAGFYVVVAGTMGALWRVAADGSGGMLAGYSAAQLTWYLAASEAVTVSLNSRLIERIGDDIVDGGVAVELLRPASVVAVRVWSEVGACLPRLGACAATGVVLASVTGGPVPDAGALLLVLPAMLLAVMCNLVAQHGVAALSFWVRDTRSSWFLYQKLVFILGGMLIPLQLLPTMLRRICFALPFMAMAYAPGRLAAGFFEPWLLLVQVAWLVVLSVGTVAVFAAGERRLQVVGG